MFVTMNSPQVAIRSLCEGAAIGSLCQVQQQAVCAMRSNNGIVMSLVVNVSDSNAKAMAL